MKLFLAFILACVFTVNTYAIVATPYSNSFGNTGSITYKDQVFVSVRNKTGTAFVAGVLVRPDTTTYDDGASVVLVGASAEAQRPMCMVAEAIANGATGKCQVYGYTDILLYGQATTAVVGESIFGGSATAGYALAIASGSIAVHNVSIGSFLDASAATGAIEAFLNFL